MMRILTVRQQRDQPITKYTHNPVQVDMNTDLVFSYFIFFLDIDSTIVTVDHEYPHKPIFMILHLVFSYFVFACNFDCIIESLSELCCQVCVTAFSVKVHISHSQISTNNVPVVFMILVLVSSYLFFAFNIDSTFEAHLDLHFQVCMTASGEGFLHVKQVFSYEL